MRVLVFTDEYDYSYYTFIYNEIKKLEEAGAEIFVVCERVGKLKEGDTNYSCIPQPRNRLLQNIYLSTSRRKWFFIAFLYRYFRERKKILEAYKPDLVHVHFGDTAARLYFPLERSFQKYPFLVSFHGFDASHLLNRDHYVDLLRELLQRPNFFSIYVSKHLRNNLLEKGLPIDDKKSFLLYYGIDPDQFFRTRRVNNDVRIFLQISGFYEKKGHIYTLRAFSKFLERNEGRARLIIGGDGPLREEIMKNCAGLGLSHAVEFPGWISRDRAVELLNEADYFVHHSVTSETGDQEGLPNAILEAMSMELPVISTFHSGIPELVEDGVNGYLVAERDVDTYADRMEKILKWGYLPVNRIKISDKFSLKAHTGTLLDIYDKLAGKKS